MQTLRRYLGCLSVAAAAAAGCTSLEPIRDLPLAKPTLSKTGVVLDVLFVRFPVGDPELNQTVWSEIDELHFPVDLRRRLENNGFRAGILSGALPLKIEQLLELTDRFDVDGAPKEVDVEREPAAKQRQLRVRGGRRSNVIVMGETERVPEMSLLLRDDAGQVKGRTFQSVLGQFATRAYPKGDGGVRLEMIPELEHGAPQKRFVPGDGMFRVEFGPPREVLDQLRIEANLAPSQMLVLTALPKKTGSLGYRFFTESRGDVSVQKMILVRLAHSEYDDRFSDGAPPVDEEQVKKLDVDVLVHE